MARKTNGTKTPTRGGQLLDRGADHRPQVAEKMAVSTSLVDRWVSGERRPTPSQIARLTALYRIPAEAWSEPALSRATVGELSSAEASSAVHQPAPWSPLPPWLLRLCREGITGIDHDDAERDRTASVIASTLEEHPELIADALRPLAKHPKMIADVLEALRLYAGEAARPTGRE